MPTLLLILIAAVSYALGSVNGAIITSKYLFRKDIRDFGSGNAGLTNFYRTFGLVGAALVLFLDIAKAVLAVIIGGLLMGIVDYAEIGRLFAGFCAILGHCFPAFYGFRGGKGALSGLAVVFLVDWRVGLIVLAAFLLCVIFTRYVSLGSIVGAALFPLGFLVLRHTGLETLLALFTTLIILFNHRNNIGRLITRSESKLEFVGKRTRRGGS